MTVLLTAAQMRALEQGAMDTGVVTGLELMERAGRGVVAEIFAMWPDLQAAPHKAVVLCGPGNNGGDGFVIARLLRAWGWSVEVYLYGNPAKLPSDAKTNHDRWCAEGDVADLIADLPVAATYDPARTVLVDALFGTGLTRPLPEDLCAAITTGTAEMQGRFSPSRLRTVAVDAPSGLCLDSGRRLGVGEPWRFTADLTVTFQAAKQGHYLAEGPRSCGHLRVVDIGLGPRATEGPHSDVAATARDSQDVCTLVDPPHAASLIPAPDGHKYNRGHALVVSGGMGRSGAARLAARGALRIGAGLVTVGAPGAAMMECAAQLTAIMLRRCDGAEGLATLLEDARLTALCLGPGMGVTPDTRALVKTALGAGRATVLDADALTSFADAPQDLFACTRGTSTVLTPHGGEFAQLFPDIAAQVASPAMAGPAPSKVDAVCRAAKRAGCTVLLKGADTGIADASGVCAVHAAVYDRAAPWLATAGAGDVLAGFITGLLARGLSPFDAAQTGAWLHVEAARAFGPGLIAEDLPEALPQVFQALAAG